MKVPDSCCQEHESVVEVRFLVAVHIGNRSEDDRDALIKNLTRSALPQKEHSHGRTRTALLWYDMIEKSQLSRTEDARVYPYQFTILLQEVEMSSLFFYPPPRHIFVQKSVYNKLMDSLARSDLFFFITTIAVVLVTALVVAALIYVVRILRDIKSLSQKLEEGGDAIANDISSVHKSIKTGIAKAVNAVKKATSKSSKTRKE